MSLPFSASKYVLNISSVSNLAFLSTFEPNNSQKRCVFVLFSAFSFFLLSLFSATFYILYAILYLFWPLLTALFSKPISIQALQVLWFSWKTTAKKCVFHSFFSTFLWCLWIFLASLHLDSLFILPTWFPFSPTRFPFSPTQFSFYQLSFPFHQLGSPSRYVFNILDA